ncbi:MAG: hypothetical protein H0X65_11010 [Gemmatimonadetes bacterium]|nr:hypothetical protein [Gemmatimonadota bacterium]
MIESAVEELTPLIGTRPACRALGTAPATIYRRRRPPAPHPARVRTAPERTMNRLLAERDEVRERRDHLLFMTSRAVGAAAHASEHA